MVRNIKENWIYGWQWLVVFLSHYTSAEAWQLSTGIKIQADGWHGAGSSANWSHIPRLTRPWPFTWHVTVIHKDKASVWRHGEEHQRSYNEEIIFRRLRNQNIPVIIFMKLDTNRNTDVATWGTWIETSYFPRRKKENIRIRERKRKGSTGKYRNK
jgi:hypothetical protein